jgi:hypothetical protein
MAVLGLTQAALTAFPFVPNQHRGMIDKAGDQWFGWELVFCPWLWMGTSLPLLAPTVIALLVAFRIPARAIFWTAAASMPAWIWAQHILVLGAGLPTWAAWGHALAAGLVLGLGMVAPWLAVSDRRVPTRAGP